MLFNNKKIESLNAEIFLLKNIKDIQNSNIENFKK